MLPHIQNSKSDLLYILFVTLKMGQSYNRIKEV